MWKVYLVEFITVLIVSFVWVKGIDKMMTEHPDYKGEDFLSTGKEEDWDDIFKEIEGPINAELPLRVKNWLKNKYKTPIKK